ncbi:hypothetical protein [Flavobacterium sp. BFFFF1]|uniref:hypothetical protein n=1 Tax=Flavobacterium sp. BFFFF1 TaxID=2015557 RepID=UPI0025B99F1A|nr:hypothetical protein [Flavobacterium sp. BFFFF1]
MVHKILENYPNKSSSENSFPSNIGVHQSSAQGTYTNSSTCTFSSTGHIEISLNMVLALIEYRKAKIKTAV